MNGNRHFEGQLENFEQGRLTLVIGAPKKTAKNMPKKKPGPADAAPQKLEIDLANVEKANLVPEI